MKRPWVLVLLSLLLAAVTVGSLLFTPASATNRLRPIPAHAQMVYNNKNPDWFLSFFPMLGSHCMAAGESFPNLGKTNDDFSNVWKKEAGPNAVGSNPWKKMDGFFQTLEKCPLTVATVSFSGREGRNAWVAVSELGGPAALAFRWRLMLSPPKGVEQVRSYAVWPIWKFEHPSLPVWARVRFSLTDGLLICSISEDSHDIYKLLNTLDGRATSLANRRNL